jgi:dTDP-4-amino-4,6-dideoxygalactose transaminase
LKGDEFNLDEQVNHNKDPFISFSPPFIGEEEIEEVVRTLSSDWITTADKTRRFEEAFAGYVGAEKALAVSSATDAMQVGLAAMARGIVGRYRR